MPLKYTLNPFTSNFDAIQNLSEYAKLAIRTTQDNAFNNLINNSLIVQNQWYLVYDYRGYAKVPNTSPAVYYGGSIFISDNEPVGTTYPVTSATSNTVTDSTKSWTANAYVGYYVKITAGTGIGQERLILSNTTDTVTTTTDWTITPDGTSYYDIEMTEQILLRGATSNEFAPDGYSISYPDENIVFTQDIAPIISTVQGTWEDEASYGTNTISDVTTYGFTIDDLGYHWSNKAAGYAWYIESYDMYGSQYYDYGEIYHQLYAYMDSSGIDLNAHQIKITGAETFHVELKGFLPSDLYLDDPNFYIDLSDGTNRYYVTNADLGTMFTFDDNGDFVWLDSTTYPLDLTRLMLDSGYIDMAYNTTSILTTIDDNGLVSIPDQGVLYICDRQIYNNYNVSPIDATNLYMEMPRPFSLRKTGSFTATFYDSVNDVTITLTDAGEGLDWSWNGTDTLTLLDGSGGAYTGLFDFQNVDYSLIGQFSFNYEFQAFDMTRSGSSMYIEWYYILREIQGMITKRYNSAYNLEVPFDYRNRVIRRYKSNVADYVNGSTYNAGDVVKYSGGVFICFRNGTTVNPNDATFWMICFADDGFYCMSAKDYSFRISTTATLNATATIPYNPLIFKDYRMFDVQQMYNQTTKLNSKITCVDNDLDLYFPQDKIGQFYNNKIHCGAGKGSTVIGNWTDNDCVVSESLIWSMFQTQGLISNSILINVAQSNFNYMNGCYIRYINRSNVIYIEAVFLAGSMQASYLAYLIQVTFWYGNVNYNTVNYLNTGLYKGGFLYNLSSADWSRVEVAGTCSQNVIVGTFTDHNFGSQVQQNNIVGQFTTTNCTNIFNGNWIRLGGSNTIKSLQTSTITSMANNNCPNVDFSYMDYGTLSNNTGTGQATVRYNKGETFQSNNFYSGENSMEIRNNIATEISSNTFRGRCNVGYNFVGYRINSCTFLGYCNVTYNQINGWLLSTSFGNGASSTYCSYNNIFAIETSNLSHNYQYNFNFDAMSSYTSTMALTSRFIMKNSASYFSVGYNDIEAVHSTFQVFGAISTRYLSTNANNTLNKGYSTLASYKASNTDQTLPPASTCDGREYTIQNVGTGTTTIKVSTTNKTIDSISIASPCVVTITAHKLTTHTRVKFTTTGALPTGLTVGTYYWLGGSIGTNTFNIYPSLADARVNTNIINTSGTQSGTHTLTVYDSINGTDTYVLYGLNESAICVAPELGNDWKIKASYIPKIKTATSGAIQIGDGTNYSNFETDGTLQFVGTATVFNDLQYGVSGAIVPASSAPAWSTFNTDFNEYTFGVNDYIDLGSQEIPHSYKEGTDLEVHIHWATNGTNVDARTVKWQVQYCWAKMDAVSPFTEVFNATTTISAETTLQANVNSLSHIYTSIGTITGTNLKIGTQLKMRLKRIASSGTEPTGNPFALQVGLHYEADTIGSRTVSGK